MKATRSLFLCSVCFKDNVNPLGVARSSVLPDGPYFEVEAEDDRHARLLVLNHVLPSQEPELWEILSRPSETGWFIDSVEISPITS